MTDTTINTDRNPDIIIIYTPTETCYRVVTAYTQDGVWTYRFKWLPVVIDKLADFLAKCDKEGYQIMSWQPMEKPQNFNPQRMPICSMGKGLSPAEHGNIVLGVHNAMNERKEHESWFTPTDSAAE